MSGQVFELNPVSHLTTGAVGQPGQRVFYLQAASGAEVVTLIVEKLQVEALAQSITQLVDELYEKFPDLTRAEPAYRADRMTLRTPLDPALINSTNLAAFRSKPRHSRFRLGSFHNS